MTKVTSTFFNVFLYIMTCSLSIMTKCLTNTSLLLSNTFIYLTQFLFNFLNTNNLSPITDTYKIYKSTKLRLTMYLVVYSILSNYQNSLHYSNANRQYNCPNITKLPNNRQQLYYLFIINNLGYIVYSKNISNNKKAKSYNGNIKYNTKMIKYMQFNKSNSHFQNFKTKLEQILLKDSPDILALSEANIYTSKHLNYLNKIEGYTIETNEMSKYIGFSRNAILIKNDINYKRRHDLEHPIISTIWIQIKTSNKKCITFMGGYRQWKLPKALINIINDPNHQIIINNVKLDKLQNAQQYKELVNSQLKRYNLILQQWNKALMERNHTIVLMDDNIDTSLNANHNKKNSITNLYDQLLNHINNNDITQHNNNYTRYVSHQPPSTIDHIYSNCPNNIKNICTNRNIFSDHCTITGQYHSKETLYQPKFFFKRNVKLLTKCELTKYILLSTPLQTIFQSQDPNYIANTIMNELNNIIEIIAPAKKVQFKKKYQPFLSQELLQDQNEVNDLLTEAIFSKSPQDWNKFRAQRNKYNNKVKTKEKEYYQTQFSNNKYQWIFLQNFTNKSKQNPPNSITIQGINYTSPKVLANLCNDFFIEKISKIRNNFTNSLVDPLKILEFLIPRNPNSFQIQPITVEKTKAIIKKLRNSNSTGHDLLSNKILKKINDTLAPHVTHLINSIIITNIYPDIFKISRILPLSKPKKKISELESYRPINNLPCLEKIFEEYFKQCLVIFLNNNDVINNDHHGAIQQHSTVTALTMINSKLIHNYENNKISALLSTDLSAAYDTIDNNILLAKLEHYGIRGNTSMLMRSYLTNRKQFVQLETFSSNVTDALPCSCVQGSKISSILYTLYTNEVPLLYKLLNSKWYNNITGENIVKFNNVQHLTVNFVDDSNSVITFNDQNQAKTYLESYYKLLHNFYNINKLKINPDKTSLLLNYKPKHSQHFKNFKFYANGYEITPQKIIKILGSYIREDLKMDTQVGKLAAQLHNRIFEMKKLNKFTDFKTRLSFLNAYVIGKLNYILPIYMHANKKLKDKLHKVLMTAARCAIGNYCFRKSIGYILNKCKWETIDNMILNASINLINKIIINKEPEQIYNLYTINRRSMVKIYPKYDPKGMVLKNFFIYKSLPTYNNIPKNVKNLSKNKFQAEIKYLIRNQTVSDTND